MNCVFGCLRDHVVALGHQLLEADAGLVAAIGIERELEPALVGVVERLEERRRLGDVDEHRDVQPRARRPRSDRAPDRRRVSRLPSAFRTNMPRSLKIFSPIAPALMSASSCVAAFAPKPGPTRRGS